MSFLDEKKGEGVGGRKKKTRVFPSKKEQRWREEKKGGNPEMAHFVRFPPLKIGGQSREKGNFSSEPKEERSQKNF